MSTGNLGGFPARSRYLFYKGNSPRTATTEMEFRERVNWLTLHVKAMKYHKTVLGTQHAFYAGQFKFQSSLAVEKTLQSN